MKTPGNGNGPFWEMSMINGSMIRRQDQLGLPNFQLKYFPIYFMNVMMVMYIFHHLSLIFIKYLFFINCTTICISFYFKHFPDRLEWVEIPCPPSFVKCSVTNYLSIISVYWLPPRCNGIHTHIRTTPSGWGPFNDGSVHSRTEHVKLLVTHVFALSSSGYLTKGQWYTLFLYNIILYFHFLNMPNHIFQYNNPKKQLKSKWLLK